MAVFSFPVKPSHNVTLDKFRQNFHKFELWEALYLLPLTGKGLSVVSCRDQVIDPRD